VSIVNHAFNGSRNFFWRHLKLHLTDSLLDLFHRAFITLGLVALRVLKSLFDSLLELLSLHVGVLSQLTFLLLATGLKSGLKLSILLFSISGKTFLHILIDLSELCQQSVLLVHIHSSLDLSVDAVTFSHTLLERIEAA